MPDSLLLALRVLVALAVVVALVWYLARRLGGRAGGGSREVEVRVLDRQGLGRRSGIAVVAAGDRRLLVGFADQGVQLLTELAPVPTMPKPAAPAPAAATPAIPTQRTASPLAGSVLSPQTWQTALRAMQDRTVRR